MLVIIAVSKTSRYFSRYVTGKGSNSGGKNSSWATDPFSCDLIVIFETSRPILSTVMSHQLRNIAPVDLGYLPLPVNLIEVLTAMTTKIAFF
jgi:hypothetical protein